jgi:hypothetical protein
MKRITLLALAIILGLGFCIGESKKLEKTEVPELPKTDKGTENKPLTNIKVNKEYDSHGNLIRYDSISSWSYSSNGENVAVNDSMLNELKSHFDQGSFLSLDDFFDEIMPQDSASGRGSDLNSLFNSQFRQHREQMNKLFSEMDSMESSFLKNKKRPDSIKTVPQTKN